MYDYGGVEVMSNFAFIGGVVKAPVYFMGDNLCVELEIYRRDLSKVEDLTIFAAGKENIAKALANIKEGNYFFTEKAYLRTRTYIRKKELECSECYNVEYQKVKSEVTELIFEDFCILDIANGVQPYGINKVFLEGNVVNDLNYREKDGKAYCKYKLAVNKNIYDSEAEYPFVVTFGKDAELSKKYLERNSRVLVEGSIQERIVKQTTDFICPECGNFAQKKVPNIVREIITSSVLFLDKKKDLIEAE